jgi:PAS domain S-box-containing protein
MDEQKKQATTPKDIIDSSKPITFRDKSMRVLRQLAEKILKEETVSPIEQSEALSPEESQRVIHELKVHQIELEAQKEELRRSQETLELLYARYFDLYDLAPVGYCTLSENGLILEANFTAAYLLDVSRRELKKQPISRFIFKDDQDIYYLSKKQLLETRESQVCEVRLVGQSGSIFWANLETTIARNEKGMTVYRVVLSDISRRKQSEEELKRIHTQNQEILDSITDAFISLTDDLVVSYFNAAAERMLNRPRIEVVGHKLFDVFPEAKGSIFEEKYKEAIRTKTAMSFQIEFTISPYQNWYDVRVYPSPEGITIYFLVITKRKHAEIEEARVELVNQQLQKAESLGRMAGAIAHHFNNKLHVVKGYLEHTIDNLPPSDNARSDLTIALEEAEKAAVVSKTMLTYLGHVTEKKETVRISEVCQNFLPLIEVSLPDNWHLKTDLQFPSPVIKANAIQIQQILTNLLTNAWEAVGDGQGNIHFDVKTVTSMDIPSSGRHPIDWQPDNTSYVCLEIQDNGCGIADTNIREIFSPFFSTKFTGRGLGLAVVLGLVKAHNGAVTAESSLGQGSVFRIFLPILAEAIIQPTVKSPNIFEIEETGTVLLVDDDDIVLEVTSVILSTLGYKVLKARDGIEALEVFRQHKGEIRLVISDVAMPRLNGWETLLALREITPGLPVILASGFSEEHVMDKTHAEAPQAFLAKPYGFKTLRETICRALQETNE